MVRATTWNKDTKTFVLAFEANWKHNVILQTHKACLRSLQGSIWLTFTRYDAIQPITLVYDLFMKSQKHWSIFFRLRQKARCLILNVFHSRYLSYSEQLSVSPIGLITHHTYMYTRIHLHTPPNPTCSRWFILRGWKPTLSLSPPPPKKKKKNK